MKTPQVVPPPQAAEVDEEVWRAIAGASVSIPGVNSYVYYFPQGNLEQCSTASTASARRYNFAGVHPWFPCQVVSVRFLCDPVSDQVFASFFLQPLQPLGPRPVSDATDGAEDDDVVSYAKVLTRSDANNGGGFSVPRFCADMILPQLNFAADPPVQTLVLTDTLNNVWEFRHIYRGTPRRHLLTTGWTKYVNAKKLVSGDTVVFMRKRSTNKLFIGLRREMKFAGAGGSDLDEAAAAIKKAVRGISFEVVYYPMVGIADFVVQAEKVKEALRIRWNPGMRVRMSVETDDSSRTTWIHGVISAVAPPNIGPWSGSPWRMLQVQWDDPEISKNIKNINRVSPWQVEYISLSPLILQDPGLLIPNNIHMPESSSRSSNFSPIEFPPSSMAGLMNSPLLNYPPLPAGMQGARRDPSITTANGVPDSPRREAELNGVVSTTAKSVPDELNGTAVSTALSIGMSCSDKASSSSDSQRGVKYVSCRGKRPASTSSFQLFGRRIQMPPPLPGKGKGCLKCSLSCSCGGKGCLAYGDYQL